MSKTTWQSLFKDKVDGWEKISKQNRILLYLIAFISLVGGYKFLAVEDAGGDFLNIITGRSKFVIAVSGSPGMEYHGAYTEIGASSSKSQSVVGKVPATYHSECGGISLSFQKQSRDGELEIRIMKNGEQVNHGQTSAEFGVINLVSK